MKKKTFIKLMAVAAILLCTFSMTACNMRKDKTDKDDKDMIEDVKDDAADMVEDVGDKVDDTMDSVGDAVSDGMDSVADAMAGYDFSKYDDGKEYLMGQLNKASKNQDFNGVFEIRDESKDPVSISDSGKGYHFKVYNKGVNADGVLFGDYYVDSENGDVYKKNSASGAIEPYEFGSDMR